MDMRAAHRRWLQSRHDELAAPESWLGLVGLFWLEPGINQVGSADGSLVHLPGGPACLGELRWENGRVFWHPVAGESRELQTDAAGQPSTVDHENWSFFIVDRDGHLAARLRDRDWAAGKPFAGLDYFDFDPAWRIEAEWQVALAAAQNGSAQRLGRTENRRTSRIRRYSRPPGKPSPCCRCR